MPGIPWTSKGCNTCRRRKVGCDQTRPSCKRCSKTGRICEGYERPDKSRSHRSPRRSDAGSATAHSTPDAASPHSTDASSISLVQLSPIAFPAELDLSDISDNQLLDVFLDIYYPKFPDSRSNADHIWLIAATQLAEPGNALRLALRAVAMSRIGYTTSNEDLVTQGQTHYIGALSEFQKALWDPAESREDRTLAAGRALTLYEAFASTSFKGWNSHSKGFASMLQMRGPETLQSPLAKQMIESYRATSMFQSLQFREASFLTLPEWSAHTYDAGNTAQALYDIGLEMAAFLQDMDRISESTGPLMDMAWQTLLARCVEFDRKLERYWSRLVSEQQAQRLPMYWETSAGRSYLTLGDTDYLGQLSPIEFHDVYTAHVVMIYWALKAIVAGTMGMLCQKTSLTGTAFALEEGKTYAAYEVLRHQPDSAKCQQVADRIGHYLSMQTLRALPYCFRDEMGMVGPLRTLFPMRIALMTLRMQVAPELDEGEKRFAELTTKKGVGYALQMKEIPESRWDAIEKSRQPQHADADADMAV